METKKIRQMCYSCQFGKLVFQDLRERELSDYYSEQFITVTQLHVGIYPDLLFNNQEN